MNKVTAIVLAAICGGGVFAAADRIFTTPNPAAELKRLFPAAAAFSPLAGTPLHFNAYAADPKASPAEKPIGIAFWTTDLVPDEHGYHGPIHILVGMDMAGVLTGVVVTYDSEPYGYFSVEPYPGVFILVGSFPVPPGYVGVPNGPGIPEGSHLVIAAATASRARLEMGKSSVTPCTRPMTIAWKYEINCEPSGSTTAG